MKKLLKCTPLSNYQYKSKSNLKCILDKSWIYKDILGEGSYGQIWQACCQKDCRYVAKYQSFEGLVHNSKYYEQVSPKDIENEVKYQNAIADIGLSIPVIDAWICQHGGVIIMKALKQTVYSMIIEYKTQTVRDIIFNKVLDIISELHKNGYYHGDIHLSNIMVNYNIEKYVEARVKYPNNELKKYKYTKYTYYFIDMNNAGVIKSNESIIDYENLHFSVKYSLNEYIHKKYLKKILSLIELKYK